MPTMRDRANKLRDRIFVRMRQASGGRVGTRMGKAPILLLTTTGRRSGKPHTRPLIHVVDGDDLVVVASNAGQDHAPDWFRNIQHDPNVVVDGRPMTATVVPDDEAADLWPKLDVVFGGYRKYRAKTERVIPLVRLRPR